MSAPQGRDTMRLLVIDPDQGTAAALGGLLRGRVDKPFQADWVGDVEGALRLIDQQAHDVWLIDHEFDRAERGALVNAVVSAGFPPLVLLGGHRDPSVEESVIAAGAADFMWKEELSAPLLQSALRYALGVRERVRLERQLHLAQRLETVGQLAGGIAHEFNNILTAIIGFGSLLAERVESDEASSSQVREILSGAERATVLTRDLLAFSRRQVMRPARLDLPEVVQHLSRMLNGVLGSHIALRVRCAEHVPAIRADRAQLEQAITNLAINAREAMPQGGALTLEVDPVALDSAYCDAHISARPGEYVRLSVTDTGKGIPKELLPRIFEPFFTTRDVSTGSGLGLSMVYGIVKQSGGNIWAYSEPGIGTTFKLYFPVEPSREAAEAAPPPAARERLEGSETILVVDDTDTVRRLTRDVLSRAGYQVLEAASPDDALKMAAGRCEPIHLLVTDVVMPGSSGVELVGRLRSVRPDVGVLYISGYTDMAIVREGLLENAAAFLQKPFTPEDLLRRVRQVLETAGQH
jgi:signal transduction histidine kinase/ActR/RegA family two-component response regulator